MIKDLIKKEIKRQKGVINLIPSENYASKKVLEALGSPLTNKYAEGYPGKRYYSGNEVCDEIELCAQKLARKIFGLSDHWHVNVQPYSGTPANLAVYFALLKPGDVLMGMNLSHGGHLTHGSKASLSGRYFNAVHYGVDLKTGLIDYNQVFELAKKHKPKLIVCGATAYPRKIDFKKFGGIAKSVGAYLMADISHIAGLIVASLYPSPFEYADIVTTTTHKTLRGPRAAIIFANRQSLIARRNNIDIASAIDKAVFPGIQGGPHMNAIAAMAAAFEEALKPSFKVYQKQVIKNAKVLAEELKKYGFDLISGSTDNHLLLMDLRKMGINGFEAEKRLEKAGILVNRNVIPGDKNPIRPSGIRIGTPAVTTLGMKEDDMIKIARKIAQILNPRF